MVEQCSLTSSSNFLALTMWQGRPQKEKKWQISGYDGEKKRWDGDKYVAFHKEQHAIMESIELPKLGVSQ